MKVIHNWIGVLSVVCILGVVSCNKNDNIELISPLYKDLNLSGRGNLEIPVLTDNWHIESVLYVPSNEVMLDKEGNPLTLGDGTIEAANGWLALKRSEDNKLIVTLKENFDVSNERKFAIYINDGSHRDYVSIVQQAGAEYELVKSEYEEIETEREIYVSDEGCSSITFTNNTSEAVWEPTGYIFEDVVESSSFESDVYGAFDWTQGKNIEISMPELLIDNKIYWTDRCLYREGPTTTPYIKDIPGGSKILVQPYSTLKLRGEVTYCKRVYNCTFTIENTSSGTRFETSGVWTHITPIATHTISE
ncbi:hypothetical protein [Proteiniphilum acetatigenes]|uniref:hypothetical protein n=1 Tax=Proteiniphilum acetatigenes TaxID=294710 RepID=UPI00036E73C6|nr:hypothetical protein [Proteiniphilum acetatigenes]SFK47046.1 hypothetical protein SAMN05216357_102289 [Porphyromonadaceae bacterium KH3CP3RA]